MDRKALLAVIHIAKKDCFSCTNCGAITFSSSCPYCTDSALISLTEERYRNLLKEATGQSSCSLINDENLMKVVDLFNRAGFKKEHPYLSPQRELSRERRRVMKSIQIRAPAVLGETWEARVAGFVHSVIKKDKLQWCTMTELRRVYGWLNRTDKYNKKNGEKNEKRN